MSWFSDITQQLFPSSKKSNTMGEEAESLTDTVSEDEKLLKKQMPVGFHALTNASKDPTGFTPFASRILQKAKQRLLRQENEEEGEDEQSENDGHISPVNLFKTADEGSLDGYDPMLQQSKNNNDRLTTASKKMPKTH